MLISSMLNFTTTSVAAYYLQQPAPVSEGASSSEQAVKHALTCLHPAGSQAGYKSCLSGSTGSCCITCALKGSAKRTCMSPARSQVYTSARDADQGVVGNTVANLGPQLTVLQTCQLSHLKNQAMLHSNPILS